MNIIDRTIQKGIENKLFKGKIIVIYGARRVGKTTLIKQIQAKFKDISIYLNCDEPDIRDAFTDATSTKMKAFIGSKKLVFLDEAQRIKNIGLSLKLLADNFPDLQVISTGSSSFDLSNQVKEPLTGRKYEFHLYTFSYEELLQIYSINEIDRILDTLLIYGLYPELIQQGQKESETILRDLCQSYLYKDVLQYQMIKHPEILEKLLQALALQIGNEVSYNELSKILGIDKKTVANYIQILEQGFVIYRLRPFSRNLRNELSKLRKIYFYDLGIRNCLINNLNPLHLRQDVGQLWENYLISERLKLNNNHNKTPNTYFWRTHQQQELDYIEEKDNNIDAYEFKWKRANFRIPRQFVDTYPKTKFKLISRDNYKEFCTLLS